MSTDVPFGIIIRYVTGICRNISSSSSTLVLYLLLLLLSLSSSSSSLSSSSSTTSPSSSSPSSPSSSFENTKWKDRTSKKILVRSFKTYLSLPQTSPSSSSSSSSPSSSSQSSSSSSSSLVATTSSLSPPSLITLSFFNLAHIPDQQQQQQYQTTHFLPNISDNYLNISNINNNNNIHNNHNDSSNNHNDSSNNNDNNDINILNSNNEDYFTYVNDLRIIIEEYWTERIPLVVLASIYAVIFGISFFGNFLVVFTMIMDNRWNSAISLFLLSLAIADLIFIIICLPYEFASRHAFNWTGPSWMCKMASFVEMLVACTSVLNLVAVSIERYTVIVHPIKSKLWCSRGRTHRIIGFMWLAAALLSSPTIPLMDTTKMVYNNSTFNITIYTCSESHGKLFVGYQLFVMFLMPSAILAFCYSHVINVLWNSTRQLYRMESMNSMLQPNNNNNSVNNNNISNNNINRNHNNINNSSNKTTLKVDNRNIRLGGLRPNCSYDIREIRKQIIKMLLVIIVVFFLCWGPKWIFLVLKRFEADLIQSHALYYAMLVMNTLPYLQSMSNPFIYCFMSRNFRKSIRQAFRRCFVRCCRGYVRCSEIFCVCCCCGCTFSNESSRRKTTGIERRRERKTVARADVAKEEACVEPVVGAKIFKQRSKPDSKNRPNVYSLQSDQQQQQQQQQQQFKKRQRSQLCKSLENCTKKSENSQTSELARGGEEQQLSAGGQQLNHRNAAAATGSSATWHHAEETEKRELFSDDSMHLRELQDIEREMDMNGLVAELEIEVLNRRSQK